MENQQRDETMLQHDTSTTQHDSEGGEPTQTHQASNHHHNKVNDITSSESSNQTKKRSREEEEEEEAMNSSSSSSSSSSPSTPTTKQLRTAHLPTSLCEIKEDIFHLLTFVLIDDLKNILFVNNFLKEIVCSYLERLVEKSNFTIPDNFSNLKRAWEMLELLPKLPNYNPKQKVTLKIKNGVHEVVGSWTSSGSGACGGGGGSTYQQTLVIPCDNMSIIGEGQEETIILGGLVAKDGMNISVTTLTMKNVNGWHGLYVCGKGTKMEINQVTMEECLLTGISAYNGAKLVAKNCHCYQNGVFGVYVHGFTTTACLTNCTSHHNMGDGVCASSGAVVDLMGERTSVHDNKGRGLYAYNPGTIINIDQCCVLNDMSHGNKKLNIWMEYGGIVQQQGSNK